MNIQDTEENIEWNIKLLEIIENYTIDLPYLSTRIRYPFATMNGASNNLLSVAEIKQFKELFLNIKKLNNISRIESKKNIFIPTLRTAHSLFSIDNSNKHTKFNEDIFLQTIIKNYPTLNSENVEIFTGITLYNEIINARNDIKEKRDRFQAFEKFISDNFFKGQQIDVIAKFDINEKNKNNNDSELINIYIDGENRSIYELGDGIQALIILMYKIYMTENNTIVFI